jgi:hypothetical protein
MQVIALMIITLTWPVSLFAAECRAVKWPYTPAEVAKIQPADLQAIQRPHLFSYLYYELSKSPDQRTGRLARTLFRYLINTEINEGRYNLLQALEASAELDSENPQVIPLKDLCDMQDKVDLYSRRNREPDRAGSKATEKTDSKTRAKPKHGAKESKGPQK